MSSCPICKKNKGEQSCSNEECGKKVCFECVDKLDGYCCEQCRSSGVSQLDFSLNSVCCHSVKEDCGGSVDCCDRKGCTNYVCGEHKIYDDSMSFSYCSEKCKTEAQKSGHKIRRDSEDDRADWWRQDD